MTDASPPSAPKKTYRKSSEYVWDAVRRDFVAGDLTLPEACRRHDVSYDAAVKRARKQGWRKERVTSAVGDRYTARDALMAARLRASPPSWAVEEAEPPAPPQGPGDAARDAFARSARAMAQGRPHEAQAWARLTAQMAALKLDGQDGGGGDPDADPRAAARPRHPDMPITPDLSGRPKPGDDYFDEDAEPVWKGGHYKYGGNAPKDPNHVDDGLDLFRYYTPGKPNKWDRLTALCEKRLDMLLRDWWTGGHWDPRVGKPMYVLDRDGRIRRSDEVPDSWFDAPQDERDRRAFYDLPLPTVRDLPAPPLAWIMEVWLPDWNARHPDAPCHVAQAWTLHQLFTRDPRLEADLVSEQLLTARTKWEERQRALGLPPAPEPKEDWTDEDAARAKDREEAWAALMARRAEAEAAEAAAGKAPTVIGIGPWRVRRF